MLAGMILANAPFPPDIRVEKKAGVRAESGHEIPVLCRGDRSTPTTEPAGPATAVRHQVLPGYPLRRTLGNPRRAPHRRAGGSTSTRTAPPRLLINGRPAAKMGLTETRHCGGTGALISGGSGG